MDVIQIERLEAFYGDMQALFGVNLSLRAGETFALVGANGAGKSTFMRSLVGLVKDRRGHIRLGGDDLIQTQPEDIARAGIALVPEGRMLFASLTYTIYFLCSKSGAARWP
jgi:branched-chain amino acid transport system ATP-binding protein